MTDAPAWMLVAACLSLTACGGSAPPVESGDDDTDGPPTFAVALRFEDAGGDEASPRTRVSLVRIAPGGERTVSDLGEEAGPCYHQGDDDALIAGRCWWGGTGAVYRIVRDGDRVVAMRAEERDEVPGELVERGHVEVPAAARLRVLSAGSAAPASP